LQLNQDRLPVAEMQAAEENGQFTYVAPAPETADDDAKPGVTGVICSLPVMKVGSEIMYFDQL